MPTAAKPRKRYPPVCVKLPRSLHAGHRGDDVLAVKRALHHAGVYPGDPADFTKTYGDSTTEALKNFQRRWNHKHKKHLAVTGVYNPATHQALVEGRNYDRRGAWLMTQASHPGVPSREQTERKLVALATYLISQAWRIHYSQTDRMNIVRLTHLPPLTHDISDDCSGAVTGIYKQCGLPDPNGRGYDGYGYTGTMIAHGQHIALAPGAWKIGDCLIYGPSVWDTHHVTMLISLGGSVFSHGSEGGPYNSPWSYRSDLIAVRRYF